MIKNYDESGIDKIYLYVKDPSRLKYQLFNNKRKKAGIKNLENLKAFIDFQEAINAVYENLEEHNSTSKRKVLIVFDYMIADIKSNKKITPIVPKLFLRGTNYYFTCSYLATLFQSA